MDDSLRNSIWNVLDSMLWPAIMSSPRVRGRSMGSPEMVKFGRLLWFDYFKKPVDMSPVPLGSSMILEEVRRYFFESKWYEVYDFLEFTLQYFDDDRFNAVMNSVLERELAGYRFVGGVFTEITGEQEVKMLEAVFTDQDLPGVKAHLKRALELLSNRDQPDYRNSIKESISAVESLAREITGNPKASLGDALKKFNKLHPALKQSFLKLYGYTSDEDGIRHAMLAEPDLTAAEAKFFLLSCTSFINYLKSKL